MEISRIFRDLNKSSARRIDRRTGCSDRRSSRNFGRYPCRRSSKHPDRRCQKTNCFSVLSGGGFDSGVPDPRTSKEWFIAKGVYWADSKGRGTQSVITNIGRDVKRFKESIRIAFIDGFEQLKTEKITYCIHKKERVLPEPTQEFIASPSLINSIERHKIKPDDEILMMFATFAEAREISRPEGIYNRDIAAIITDEIESFFKDMAWRNVNSEEKIRISEKDRFSPEICGEFIERLELDSYDPKPALDLLFKELHAFALDTPRKRSWGKIIVEDGILKMVINHEALLSPEIEEIDDSHWI